MTRSEAAAWSVREQLVGIAVAGVILYHAARGFLLSLRK
jgi:hypothetical protein